MHGLWVVASPDRDAVGRCIELATPRSLSLGRSSTAGLTIDDRWLSQHHLEVIVKAVSTGGTAAYACDSGTKNGTFVNRRRITSTQLLRDGDVVRGGATLMIVGEIGCDADDRGMVGHSQGLRAVRAAVAAHGGQGYPVHIRGESGVGKELVAQALHRAAGCTGPLVAVNVATLVSSLAESLLFGHTRGAFSGADEAKAGLFDEADGGTLFLDEIGELAADVQAKLLRVVETGEVRPVGTSRSHQVDVRLVTATHQDLAAAVEAGQFRNDLYWRLAAHEIWVPPLRHRRLDIVPLVEHFLAVFGVPRLAELRDRSAAGPWQAVLVLEVLASYDWPGNVRQLREQVRQLAALIRERLAAGERPIPSPERCLPAQMLAQDRASGARPEGDSSAAPPAEESTPLPPSDPPARPAEGDEQRPLELSELTAPQAQQLLIDRDALAAALIRAGGNINLFVRLIAPLVGRGHGSVRREIYRRLGPDGLEQVRARSASTARRRP